MTKIVMMVNHQMGGISIMLAIAKRYSVKGAVCYGDIPIKICKIFNIPFFKSIFDKEFIKLLNESDILLSVHGKEIVPQDMLDKIISINVHPCLYKYKGSDPIGKLLRDGETKASVASHFMVEEVDMGKVIVEKFLEVKGKTREHVYMELLPLYIEVLSETLDSMSYE